MMQEIYALIDMADAGDEEALKELSRMYHDTPHEPLCPHRVSGPCECIKAQMTLSIDAFDDLEDNG
jgi:hypothetical protein